LHRGSYQRAQTEMEDMFLVEVNRGCARSCRFCAASFVFVRRVSAAMQRLSLQLDRGLQRKKKIGLVGTAVSDHSGLINICEYIIPQEAQAA